MSGLDRKAFLAEHRFSEADLSNCGVAWKDLDAIAEHHRGCRDQLSATGDYVADRLRQVTQVHSLKVRVKDPGHLAAKVVRKRLEDKTVEIDAGNYGKVITDLIGIRALHLFKDEWRAINDFVLKTWGLAERPTAYVRDGDAVAVLEAFTKEGCEVEQHPFGYRSVHYLIKSQPAKEEHLVEVQVRTLFEEAWSEIDHRVRYPRASDDPYLAEFLTIFNRLAGSADEMGTFIKALSAHLAQQTESLAAATASSDKLQAELKSAVGKLQISASEKAALQKQIDALGASSPSWTPFRPSDNAFVIGSSAFATPTVGQFFTTRSKRVCSACGKTYDYDPTTVTSDPTRCPSCGIFRLTSSALKSTRICMSCGKSYEQDMTSAVTSLGRCPNCGPTGFTIR